MLNVLSNYIPDGERLITIEESAELQIQGEHVVTLETRPANAEGSGEVRIRDLVRNSLRMRPDRIIVGECRGAETLDMLQAMNTGHAGSMTTVHANTPRELLGRLETMVMMGGVELPQRAIRDQIVMAIGCLIQLQRTPAGPRVVHSITEIQGMEGETVLLQDIFHRVDMHEGFGRLVPTGLRPKNLDELALNGVEVPPHLFRNEDDALSRRSVLGTPPPPGTAGTRAGRATLGGDVRDARPPTRREVSAMVLATQLSTQGAALAAAVLLGGGLALVVMGLITRVRTKQRTLAQILDDTMGTAEVPVEVISESPEHGELSALTVRISGIFGRVDTHGALERRLERAAIPLRAGEYLVISSAIAFGLAVVIGVMTGSPIGSIVAIAVVAGVAWYLPSRKAAKRIKQIQEQLPDALALMSASVEGGQTFQRSIDMYRRDAKPPLSAELDRVMAEVAVGSDLVVALENMAERSGVEDLTWAVEAVRIQQSTGGRLAPILHTLADFMRTRQEVRREVQTLSAEGRMSGYVLFAIPIFLVFALEAKDPGYLKPMMHGAGLIVLIGTAGLMALGFWIVRRMVNIKI
jgi:Flp pilus assembly protein TadB